MTKLKIFIIVCVGCVACAKVDNHLPSDAGSSDIKNLGDSLVSSPDMNTSCTKNSPGQSCWDFSDIYTNADLLQEKWQLDSCWSAMGSTLRTARFPTSLMGTDSICEANLPTLTINTPGVTQVLVKITQTVQIDGLGNYASVYADVPTGGPVLLSRTQSQAGYSESRFALTSGSFHIRLQLKVGASNTLQDDVWKVQRVEITQQCNDQPCPAKQ